MITIAKTSVLNIRVELEMKKEIEELYSKFSITVSGVVNIFFHQSLMQGGLLFQMQVPLDYNAETKAVMAEVKELSKNGEGFDNSDDLFRKLGL